MVSSHSKTYGVEKLYSNISANLNEDDPDWRIEFCKWYNKNVKKTNSSHTGFVGVMRQNYVKWCN
jgi:hypothetical protein